MKATQYRDHIAKAQAFLTRSVRTRGQAKQELFLPATKELDKAQVYFTQQTEKA